jgi:hypothetical protein
MIARESVNGFNNRIVKTPFILERSKSFHVNQNHFCTLTSDIHESSLNDLYPTNRIDKTKLTTLSPVLTICEDLKPSYTSKKDQLSELNKQIRKLKVSKKLLKDTIQQIDTFINDDNNENNKSSAKCKDLFDLQTELSKSINITSLKNFLPKTDRSPKSRPETPKLVKEEKSDDSLTQRKELPPSSIFISNSKFLFTDKTLLENQEKFRAKKKNEIKRKVISAGFYLNRSTCVDRSQVYNNKPSTIDIYRN